MPDDFDPEHLDDTEKVVLAKVARGEEAVFDKDKPWEIRAAFLKHLLLGLPLPGRGKCWPVALTGVRIRGAHIKGKLDLSDAATPGIGLPTLALRDCDIPERMNLASARLSSLSVEGSRFQKIDLREVEIDGPLDFSDAGPFKSEGGLAWIDATGAVINGQLFGSGAHLRAPEPRMSAEIGQWQPNVALQLNGADIRGSIVLNNGFTAEGGVSLNNAHVRGDVLMAGATVTAGEDDALSAQNARIGGMVALCNRFKARGTVWLSGASIGGCLYLPGAKFRGAQPVSEPDWALAALVAENAEIGGPLCLKGTRARGQIRLANARIRGDVEADGACLLYPSRKEPAVLAESIVIGDDLFLRGGVVGGTLDLTGANIGGKLALDGTRLVRTLGQDERGQDHAALLAVNATVGENAEFRRYQDPNHGSLAFRATGRLDLTGAKIAGDLSFEGSCLANRTANAEGIALLAERARIEGNLEFRGVREPSPAGEVTQDEDEPKFTHKFLAKGEVHLAGASVGRDFRCDGACFINPGKSAIYAKDLVIGDDLQLLYTAVEGDLRFERLCISGSLKWEGLEISGSGKRGSASQLDLRYARVGSALKAVRLSLAGQAGIDLVGMRVASIQDWTPEGWGISAQSGGDCPINFDGFQYERIEFNHEQPAVGGRYNIPYHLDRALRERFRIPRVVGPPRHRRADPLLDWILHQRRASADPELNFFPQPYRQLARVLRSQGEEEAAVIVAVAERWAAPQRSVFLFSLRWLFGAIFGFGLLRGRATVFLAIYVLAGMVGVMYAQSYKMLVESTVVTAQAYAIPPERGIMTRVFVKAQENAAAVLGIPCTDTASGFPTELIYAVDMIVPFIPLHQEAKCEIKSEDEPGAKGWLRAKDWLLLKALYSVVGWVVFSLWLATFSGLLKRSEGEG